jgi:hypothetical protein
MIWNDWRKNYRAMTFDHQKKFYDLVLTMHPHQQAFNIGAVFNFLARIRGPLSVIEFGGYKGELARIILLAECYNKKIIKWTNVEITTLAKETVCLDEKYHVEVLDNWLWKTPLLSNNGYNTFLSSHTIEHLSGDDLRKLINWLAGTSIEYIYLEAPLVDDDTNYSWNDYVGSHILELGWKQVIELMDRAGFVLFYSMEDARFFQKKKEKESKKAL